MNKKIKVCLLWHNTNSENYGVGALAISHINMLMNIAKERKIDIELISVGTPNIMGLSVKEEIEQKIGVNILHINFSIKDVLKQLFGFQKSHHHYLNSDIFLDIGEGDSFSDIYGMKRFLILSFSKWVPIILKKKLLLSPQTYGPFKSKTSKIISAYLMRRSTEVFSRDFKSTQLLNDLGINNTEVADIAFSLPYEQLETEGGTVGLNISGLLWNGGYTKNNQFGLKLDYKEFVLKLIEGFVTKGKQVHLISHVISDTLPVEDDFSVSLSIKNEHFSNVDGVLVAPKFSGPLSAKTYISKMDFFLGSRMHATIAALSSGVPTIPLAYSRKFEGVFGSIGYDYTINLYELSKDDCLNKIFELYECRKVEMYNHALESKKLAVKSNNLYKNRLGEVLSELN